MTSLYPAALDTTTQLPNDKDDSSSTATAHAQHHNNISDAIIAIETILGTSPQGSSVDVSSRIANRVRYSADYDQVVQPTNDSVGLVFQLHDNTSVAHFVDFKDSIGNILAYVNHQGAFSASNYLVNGIQISSDDLSDGPFAPLNNPTFTGDSTAPTPDVADDSTRIANTHWVRLQEYVGAAYVNSRGFAPLDSPHFTGVPTAPTPSDGDSSTKIATTAFVEGAIGDSSPPNVTISSTIAGLAPDVNGKAGLLRVGSPPYDFMKVVYDDTYGHWIGDTIQQSWHADPLVGVAIASQPAIATVFPTSYPSQLSYLLTTPWGIWNSAGLIPQFRIIWNGSLTTVNTEKFYLRLGYHPLSGLPNIWPPTIIPIHESFITGTTPVHHDSGWQPLPGGYSVDDDLAVGVQMKTTVSTHANLLYAIALIRWISA